MSKPPLLRSSFLLAAALCALVGARAEPDDIRAPAEAASHAKGDADKDKAADAKARDDKPRTIHVKVVVAELATDAPKNAEGATVYVSRAPTLTVPTGKDGGAKLPGVRPGPTQLVVLAVAAPPCRIPIDAALATNFTVLVLKSGCSLSP